MIRQRQHVLIALAAALALSGCGTKNAFLVPMTAPATIAGAQAPSVITVTASQVAQSGIISTNASNLTATQKAAAPLVHTSTLSLTDEADMTQDESAADAQSQGYSVQDLSNSIVGTNFSDDGTVRKTDTGYALEVTSGFFHKTTKAYTLDGSSAVMSQIAAQLNKKVDIKGILDKDSNLIEVASVKHDISLGFLTNWLTRGKISGVVKDAYGGVLPGAHVIVHTAQGFEFDDTTGPDGYFAIKNLVSGDYTVEIDDAGYLPAVGSFKVKARKNSKVQALLVIDPDTFATPLPSGVPSVAPSATPTPQVTASPDVTASPSPDASASASPAASGT